MGVARKPKKVKLIVGLLSGNEGLMKDAGGHLERALRNTVDFESGLLEFSHTDYYREEFGMKALKRKFLSFKKLVDLKEIYRVKIKTNSVESRFSRDGKRSINIDPGYIDLSKLILFSTKDYSHRIYLGSGIFAEVTLFYRDRTFNPWPWTYPDYRSEPYIAIFNSIRNIYKEAVA